MTDQPDTLTDRIRRALAEADGFDFGSLEPHDYQRHAAAVLALVADQAPPVDRAALRDRIAHALEREDAVNAGYDHGFCGSYGADEETDGFVDAVLAVLPEPADRADEAEVPLSPDYEHPECGFHWHGRDGMDIPMQDGQPVCPRCELLKVEKQLHYSEQRREELRQESRRRGKLKGEYAEKIRLLEKQLDEVRTQLGAEILRSGQAEAELRRLAAETPQPETQPTPCSEPNPCEDGELCGVHEVEQAHAEGEHAFCGPTCEVEYPTDMIRNGILAWAPAGAKGMLAELERRAAAGAQHAEAGQ